MAHSRCGPNRRLFFASRYWRWALSTIVPIAIGCISAAGPASAQQGNLDYYVPREGQAAQLFRNVEGYHLEQGRLKMGARNFSGAFEDFDFILGYYPNHPTVLDLASQLCAQYKFPRCDMDARFEQAVARNPKVATTYVLMGIHYHRVGKIDAAIRSYKQALEIKPDSFNAYYNLGLAYVEQKQFALANNAAQHAYALGAPLPGLREKLKAVGAWQPSEPPIPPKTDNVPSASPQPAGK